jgi:hypothetical protein
MEETPQKESSIFLRIPGWVEDARVTVNGDSLGTGLRPGHYFEIRRKWTKGDRIELVFPMSVQLLEAHPLVEEAHNQTAVRRGPIVYCLESVDLPENVLIMDVAVSPMAHFQDRFIRELLGGVTILETKAYVYAGDDWKKALYRRISPQEPTAVDIRLIPYYAWGNRGDCEMTVWIPVR